MIKKILKVEGVKRLSRSEKGIVLGGNLSSVCGSQEACESSCSESCMIVYTGGAGCGTGGCCYSWACVSGTPN